MGKHNEYWTTAAKWISKDVIRSPATWRRRCCRWREI